MKHAGPGKEGCSPSAPSGPARRGREAAPEAGADSPNQGGRAQPGVLAELKLGQDKGSCQHQAAAVCSFSSAFTPIPPLQSIGLPHHKSTLTAKGKYRAGGSREERKGAYLSIAHKKDSLPGSSSHSHSLADTRCEGICGQHHPQAQQLFPQAQQGPYPLLVLTQLQCLPPSSSSTPGDR